MTNTPPPSTAGAPVLPKLEGFDMGGAPDVRWPFQADARMPGMPSGVEGRF